MEFTITNHASGQKRLRTASQLGCLTEDERHAILTLALGSKFVDEMGDTWERIA